jgi:hypothetical protein
MPYRSILCKLDIFTVNLNLVDCVLQFLGRNESACGYQKHRYVDWLGFMYIVVLWLSAIVYSHYSSAITTQT